MRRRRRGSTPKPERQLLFLIPGDACLSDDEFEEVLDEVMRSRKTPGLVRHLAEDHGVILGPGLESLLQGRRR